MPSPVKTIEKLNIIAIVFFFMSIPPFVYEIFDRTYTTSLIRQLFGGIVSDLGFFLVRKMADFLYDIRIVFLRAFT